MATGGVFVLLLSLLPVALCLPDLASVYPFNVTLVQDKYWLYWNFNTTTQNISFAVRVQTTGWIGFGLSPNGQMPGSDVVIGWIDGSNSYFHDRYALGRYTPPIDPIQNWFLTNAEEENGYTVLEFYRDFITCDDRDLEILFETSHVVYSWNDQKPTVTRDPDDGSESYTFERHTSKGTTDVNLLGGLPNPPTIPEDAQTFTIATDEITIPSADTTYWCKAIRLPENIRESEKYVIKNSPSISSASEPYVHHMLVYLCNGLEESDLGKGGSCFDGGVSDRVKACTSQLMLAGWAVGGSDFIYPENVAYPLGGANGQQFVVVETHYNNPDLVEGVIDSSGMTFTYIDSRREHNAGVLFFGHVVDYYMIVPPKADNFTITSVCSSSCSQQNFPPDGIHIFANLLHTHLAGVGLTFRRLNETTCSDGDRYQELEPVDRNLQYDFNFQQTNHLPEVVTVLPGDTLMLQCFYRTMDRNGITMGGLSTQEEMCLTFPLYYPKLDEEFCQSAPLFNRFEEFIDRYVPDEEQAAALRSLTGSSSQETVMAAFNQLDWTEQQINAFQYLIYDAGDQQSFCSPDDKAFTNTTPTICCSYQAPDSCTGFEPGPCCERACDQSAGANTLYSSLILLFAIALIVAVGISV